MKSITTILDLIHIIGLSNYGSKHTYKIYLPKFNNSHKIILKCFI